MAPARFVLLCFAAVRPSVRDRGFGICTDRSELFRPFDGNLRER